MMRSFGADKIQLLLILDEAKKLGFQVDQSLTKTVPPCSTRDSNLEIMIVVMQKNLCKILRW